jgi:hypothetical protein
MWAEMPMLRTRSMGMLDAMMSVCFLELPGGDLLAL